MAAPIGNQFWKIRSKHGRDAIFGSPKELLKAFYDYCDWNARHPWMKREAIKSGENAGKIIEIPIERPLSDRGFCSYCDTHRDFLTQFEKRMKEAGREDFCSVITHIREVIDRQQLEGAKVGAFNANIVARELGLKEHTDMSSMGQPITTAPPPINIHPVVVAGAPPISESADETTA